jgi:arylsulfatase A-like enzyme
LIVVTSDHGGIKKGHGGATMDELEIPWIAAGPGVRAGHTLERPVNVYDTAATMADVLGVTPPVAWIGRSVREAFTEE